MSCAVSRDLEAYLDMLDDADRREAAVQEVFNSLMEEYTAQAKIEAEAIIKAGCQHCYSRGCRKCETPD